MSDKFEKVFVAGLVLMVGVLIVAIYAGSIILLGVPMGLLVGSFLLAALFLTSGSWEA